MWNLLRDVLFISKGIQVVLLFSFLGFAIGLLLAIVLTLISLHHWFRPFVKFYISFFRGVPLMCQVAAFLYFMPKFMPTEVICCIVFGISCSAYLAEIFRSFIANIPVEQIETAIGIGLNKYQITRFIILPQMLRSSIPIFINEIISLSKDASILGSFGIMEIFMRGKIIGSLSYNYGRSIAIVGIVYYMITFSIAQLEKLPIIKRLSNN
jgi:cystine transport system permease protein